LKLGEILQFTKIVLPILLFVTTLTPLSLMAADDVPPFYVGGAVGQAKEKDACINTISCSNADTGIKLFGGYQFNNYLALEGGYLDFGKATISFVPNSHLSFKATAFTVAAVGSLPLAHGISLLGKVGVYRAQVKATASGMPGSVKVRNTDTAFGIGAKWDFATNFALRVEYEHFKDVGDKNSIGANNVNLISLGMSYKF
jgi:OOP family OmpA-OmpF porin